MRIALAQITTGPSPQDNLALIRARAAEAAAAGARLVLFPEAGMCAFGNRLDTVAEPLTGPFAQEVRRIARETGVVVVVGMFTPGGERGEGERRAVRNTLLVTDGRGLEAAYDKIHLFDAFGFRESDTVDAGHEPVVFELDGLKIGLALCYDIRFPALFTHYARQGCSLTLVAASWGAGELKVQHWETLAQARALDSTQFIAACGQANPAAAQVTSVPGAPTGVGHSCVIAPNGRVLASAGESPELLLAEIEADDAAAAREQIPVLANARAFRTGPAGSKVPAAQSAAPESAAPEGDELRP